MIRRSVAEQPDTTDAQNAGGILKTDAESVVDLASRHFSHVLGKSLERMSFFQGHWTVGGGDPRQVATNILPLRGVLRVQGRDVRHLIIDFHLPKGLELRETALDAWIFGKLVDQRSAEHEGMPALHLHFRVSALVSGNWDEGVAGGGAGMRDTGRGILAGETV